MDKQHILAEIKRTAEANGGVPLGLEKFFQKTGIKRSDWSGIHWVRWGDAIQEAGFTANHLQGAYNEEYLLEQSAGHRSRNRRETVMNRMKRANL